MLTRPAGRDDADGFFFAMFTLRAIHRDYQQDGRLHGTNGVPPLFACDDSVLAEDGSRIVEYQRRAFEGDAIVFPLVAPVLLAVLFKPHRYTKGITLAGIWHLHGQTSSRQTAANNFTS